MAEQKTKPTAQSVDEFLSSIADERVRADSKELVDMMKRVTGEDPVMWGTGIIGFGKYHYRYDSGHEGDAPLGGFAPRKGNIAVYLMSGFSRHEELMARLGKYKTGKSCLYVKRLADVDSEVLEELARKSIQYMREKYPD